MNAVAGAAITFKKASEPEFGRYARAVLDNAQSLAGMLLADGAELVTGGTENHLLVIDTVKSFGIDGRTAEKVLDRIGLATNKQVLPDDPKPPMRPSGIRIGTPACTTRGMGSTEMQALAPWIVQALRSPNDGVLLERLAEEVKALARRFPVPGTA